ncbi:DUF3052 domain-containing protein [Actinomyces urinae]|uniref:DUF3052 domain-containing protein n=1 Tax=Actinomyces urinae TaxID=1689268 RepID=UPI000ACD5B44|nr:DUF3052 domain-containing protein [Actinomyces urinae]
MISKSDSRKVDPTALSSLGYKSGQTVQEFYWDEDTDDSLRAAVEDATGNELVDVDYSDVVDGVIVWWRLEDSEEDDLADVLLDASANMDNGGVVWVLTPKSGTSNHVPPEVVADAAQVAGMSATSAAMVCEDWSGMRLIAQARQ